jgi:hypothetical protein
MVRVFFLSMFVVGLGLSPAHSEPAKPECKVYVSPLDRVRDPIVLPHEMTRRALCRAADKVGQRTRSIAWSRGIPVCSVVWRRPGSTAPHTLQCTTRWVMSTYDPRY